MATAAEPLVDTREPEHPFNPVARAIDRWTTMNQPAMKTVGQWGKTL